MDYKPAKFSRNTVLSVELLSIRDRSPARSPPQDMCRRRRHAGCVAMRGEIDHQFSIRRFILSHRRYTKTGLAPQIQPDRWRLINSSTSASVAHLLHFSVSRYARERRGKEKAWVIRGWVVVDYDLQSHVRSHLGHNSDEV
jgi:hypothetical protein